MLQAGRRGYCADTMFASDVHGMKIVKNRMTDIGSREMFGIQPEQPGIRRIRQRRGADMSTSDAIPEGRYDKIRKGNGSRSDGGFRRSLLAGTIALVLLLPGAGFAAEPAPAATPAKEAVVAVDNLLITTPPPPPNVR